MTTEIRPGIAPLCGEEWYQKNAPPTCTRCGSCCRDCPCLWGQLWYRLREGDKCPGLKDNKDGTTTCLLMRYDKVMRKAMLGTGCEYD